MLFETKKGTTINNQFASLKGLIQFLKQRRLLDKLQVMELQSKDQGNKVNDSVIILWQVDLILFWLAICVCFKTSKTSN